MTAGSLAGAAASIRWAGPCGLVAIVGASEARARAAAALMEGSSLSGVAAFILLGVQYAFSAAFRAATPAPFTVLATSDVSPAMLLTVALVAEAGAADTAPATPNVIVPATIAVLTTKMAKRFFALNLSSPSSIIDPH